MDEVAKKIVLLLIITFSFSLSVNSQELKNKEIGKICFLRSTGLRGAAVSLKTFIDGSLYCKLNNKKYSIHEVPIGKHDIFVQLKGLKLLKNTQKLEIQVLEGKITYVQFFLEDEFLSYKFHSREISDVKAKDILNTITEDTKCL